MKENKIKQNIGYHEIMFILALILTAFLEFISIPFHPDMVFALMIQNTILRILLGATFSLLLIKYGYAFLFNFRFDKKAILIVVLGVLISINNFPISAFFQGRTHLDYPSYTVYFYFIESLSVGFFEELIFRGLILIILLGVFENKKHGTIKAVIVSALVFSLIHLSNVFAGASITATLLQIGYSFLMGMLWSVVYVQSKNIYVVMILHATYNFFGNVLFQLGSVVDRYDMITLVVTITLALTTFLYGLYIMYNTKEVKLVSNQKQ